MDKRDIDEQLESLQFNINDETNDRNKRRGRQSAPVRRYAYRTLETSHAIIVGGLWGGSDLRLYPRATPKSCA